MKFKYLIDNTDLVEIPLYVRWTETGIYVLSDEEVKNLPTELPSDIRKEVTRWKKEDWGTRTFIDNNSSKQLPDGSFTTDINKHTDLFLQCLLKEWTLGEIDERLKIVLIDRGDVEIISPSVMQQVRKLPASIMSVLIARAMVLIRGGPDLKNLKSVP